MFPGNVELAHMWLSVPMPVISYYIDANSAFPGEQSITPNDLLPEALQNPIPQGMGVVFFKSRVRSRSRGETRRSSAHAVHHCPMSLRTLCAYRRVSPKMTDKHEGFEKIFTWPTVRRILCKILCIVRLSF